MHGWMLAGEKVAIYEGVDYAVYEHSTDLPSYKSFSKPLSRPSVSKLLVLIRNVSRLSSID